MDRKSVPRTCWVQTTASWDSVYSLGQALNPCPWLSQLNCKKDLLEVITRIK